MATSRRTSRRGTRPRSAADVRFVAAIEPTEVGEEVAEDLTRLRARVATYRHVNINDWLRAIDFLNELDDLDQLHAEGHLTHTAYARRLEEHHRAVSTSVWLSAAHLVHLSQRLMNVRGDE